ncbi:WD40-repeat-containing domain protein [Pisolithus orientalis]|uniref:WD40-repeat-containing domain protein n=1 Tax=Pisolithus orientalis TaxID=936130 RepID=UPI00222596FA|nr:WD40-repeat-containing domain protein [Pisolithus orientalis]KAI6009494.1 WD40-repeat-containing domain protein [Pisolithus orientalis]
MTATVPLLLPPTAIPRPPPWEHEWTPKRYLTGPQPPPVDDARILEQEMATARQLADGKAVKKTRPRRTVDYNGGMGRWALLRKHRPNPSYVPCMRPAPPYIIDLLPPVAYPNNSSTSLCTKFIHTSTNKIRCPVNVVTVRWTPEGRRVLTGSTSGEFTLWNGLTFNFETILQAHDSAIRAFQFTHSGAYLASADQSGIIKYFQPNMNNLNAWQGHREAIRGLSFSPNDGRFATASDDSTIRIWSFEESREERVLTGHGWDVKCVEWHPTKGLLVSGSKDNLIKFWDPRTGTILSTLHQHKNTIQALAWSPNGNLVASASRDQTVRVFDIRAMKELRVLKGHKKEVCSVTWHPIHPILVSGGSEGAVLHWDLSGPEPSSSSTSPFSFTTHGPRATLSQAHDSNVWCLTFHPLGHILVTASNDHTTRFWSRERPGDATSVFSGGGEKPPEVVDMSGQEEDEEVMVPGFSYGGGTGASGLGNGFAAAGGSGTAKWWGNDTDGVGYSTTNGNPPFGPSSDARVPFSGDDGMNSDDFIPGLGAAEHLNAASPSVPSPTGVARPGGAFPAQEDTWSGAGGSGRGDDSWSGRRGGYYGGRGGPRRGGRH